MATYSDVFAEPMLEDENFLDHYVEKLKSLKKEGVLPSDLKKKMRFYVYSIEGSGCGKHRSIVLTTDKKKFFTIELGFIKVDGTKRIYPVTKKFDPSLANKLSFHGQVEMSAGLLISRAIATMKKFGSYFKWCNNCQDYCNYYLESIGLGDTKKLTDGDKISLAGLAVGVLAVILMLLSKLK